MSDSLRASKRRPAVTDESHEDLCRLADDGCPNLGGYCRFGLSDREREAAVAGIERFLWRTALHFVRKLPSLARTDADDVFAAGRFAAWAATWHFDPARADKFLTYAARCVRRAMRHVCYESACGGMKVPHGVRKHLAPQTPLSYSPLPDDGDSPAGTYYCDPPDRERAEPPEFPPDFWEKLKLHLTEREWSCVVRHYRDGKNLTAMNAADGRSRRAAHAILQKARRKLREALARYEFDR